MAFLTTLKHALGLIIAPPFCSSCKEWMLERTIFCDVCSDNIMPVITCLLPFKGSKNLPVFAVSNYEQPLRSLILAKHWSNRLASKHLGELIWEKTAIKNCIFDVIIPIPLHWTRQIKRGFNQAEEIAKIISKRSGKPVVPLLKRKKKTMFQALLTKRERINNVAHVFELTKASELCKGQRILLVDDLMTTGSTLQAAAKMLNNLEPISLQAVVACRVI